MKKIFISLLSLAIFSGITQMAVAQEDKVKENKQEETPILDDIIAVDTEEFDKFLERLSQINFRKPTPQETITKGKLFE